MRTPTRQVERKRKQAHTKRIPSDLQGCSLGKALGKRCEVGDTGGDDDDAELSPSSSKKIGHVALKFDANSSCSVGDILPKYLESALLVDENWAEREILSILGSTNYNEQLENPRSSTHHTQDGDFAADDVLISERKRAKRSSRPKNTSVERCSQYLTPDIGQLPSLFSSHSVVTEHHTEIQRAHLAHEMGLTMDDCAPSRVTQRKRTIEEKMKFMTEPKFTLPEEFDIHERAEVYAISILPDPKFYILPSRNWSAGEFPASFSFPMIHIPSGYRRRGGRKGLPHQRRRRQSYGNLPCFVRRNQVEKHAAVSNDSYVLPEGTRLLKPPNKLVELVAQAIDASSDGLLQVQQVYQVLMNRYPYFRYMDKTSITSWRSSVRHALYQKWFRKVRLFSEVISCKGCYWAISKRHTPKEWTLPNTEESMVATHCPEVIHNSPTPPRFVEGYAFIYEPYIEHSSEGDVAEVPQLPREEAAVQFSQDAEDLSCLSAPSATYNYRGEQDPDPVLTSSIGSVTLPNTCRSTTSSASGSSTQELENGNTNNDEHGHPYDEENPIPPDTYQWCLPASSSSQINGETSYGAWWEDTFQQISYPPFAVATATGSQQSEDGLALSPGSL